MLFDSRVMVGGNSSSPTGAGTRFSDDLAAAEFGDTLRRYRYVDSRSTAAAAAASTTRRTKIANENNSGRTVDTAMPSNKKKETMMRATIGNGRKKLTSITAKVMQLYVNPTIDDTALLSIKESPVAKKARPAGKKTDLRQPELQAIIDKEKRRKRKGDSDIEILSPELAQNRMKKQQLVFLSQSSTASSLECKPRVDVAIRRHTRSMDKGSSLRLWQAAMQSEMRDIPDSDEGEDSPSIFSIASSPPPSSKTQTSRKLPNVCTPLQISSSLQLRPTPSSPIIISSSSRHIHTTPVKFIAPTTKERQFVADSEDVIGTDEGEPTFSTSPSRTSCSLVLDSYGEVCSVTSIESDIDDIALVEVDQKIELEKLGKMTLVQLKALMKEESIKPARLKAECISKLLDRRLVIPAAEKTRKMAKTEYFNDITQIIKSSSDPTIYRKIIKYEPIVVNELHRWLLAQSEPQLGGLQVVDVKAWCYARGVCSVDTDFNRRGKQRTRVG